jgi:type I restriction enzyme, S subunit
MGIRWKNLCAYERGQTDSTPTQAKTMFRMRKSDFVFNRIDTDKGALCVVDETMDGAVASNEFPAYTCIEDRLLPGYLWLYFQQQHVLSSLRPAGSDGRARWKEADFERHVISLPPLGDQRRIVDLIAAVDDAIEGADEQTASLKQTSSALRRTIFNELRNTCPESTAGQFFEVTLGRQKSARQLHGDHEIPYIRAANISDGSLSLADVQSMNFDPKEQSKYALQYGDVLVVEGGSIGQTAVWKEEIQGPVGFDKHVLRIRGLGDDSTSPFANQWARWCYETGRFEAQARGVTIKALGFQRAKDMAVPAAPLARQIEVADLLDSPDAAAASSLEVASSLRTLRTQLLSALLSGAHRIPETYDELMGA